MNLHRAVRVVAPWVDGERRRRRLQLGLWFTACLNLVPPLLVVGLVVEVIEAFW